MFNTTIKRLNPTKLTEDEKTLLIVCVNNFGNGNHPVITEMNCHNLSIEYVLKITERVNTDDLTDFGLELWASLRNKLIDSLS